MLFKSKGVEAIVAELVELLNKYNLSEIEYEKNGQRVKVGNGRGTSAPAIMAVPAAPSNSPTEASAQSVSAMAPADLSNALKSPMVGVAYLCSEPGSPNFVTEGAKVKKGDIVCLVEAMKTFNPVKSDRDGVIKKILVKQSDTVEFGQPLLIIE